MKKLILCITAIIFLSSCATYNGLSIDKNNNIEMQKRLYPIGTESFKIEFVNKSSQEIFINVNRNIKNFQFNKIEPGKSWTYNSSTKKDIDYTIKWWYKHNDLLSEEVKETKITLTALYKQGKIIIDDNFLRKKTLQKGVVVNYFPYPVDIYDSQGNDYGTLESGEFKYGELMSGPVTFYYIKKHRLRNTKKTKSFTFEVDVKNNVFFNEEWIGWRFYTQ